MRLVCPNCGAQYEVDDHVIPEDGRDVQCSNCGHTWFQTPPTRPVDKESPAHMPPQDNDADADTEAFPEDEPEASGSDKEVAASEEIEAEIVTVAPASDDFEDEGDAAAVFPELPEQQKDADSAADFVAPEPRTTPRRELDESLREILRAEAAREAEARARARENGTLETQEELGLDEPAPEPKPRAHHARDTDNAQDRQAAASQERVTRVRGIDADDELFTPAPDDTTASGGSEARRDLLPDIDEINSSLESVGPGAIVRDSAAVENEQQSGFTRGFVLVLLLAAIAVILYLYAPVIADRIPALAPAMDGWVNLVDAARNWADRLVSTALSMVQQI